MFGCYRFFVFYYRPWCLAWHAACSVRTVYSEVDCVWWMRLTAANKRHCYELNCVQCTPARLVLPYTQLHCCTPQKTKLSPPISTRSWYSADIDMVETTDIAPPPVKRCPRRPPFHSLPAYDGQPDDFLSTFNSNRGSISTSFSAPRTFWPLLVACTATLISGLDFQRGVSVFEPRARDRRTDRRTDISRKFESKAQVVVRSR